MRRTRFFIAGFEAIAIERLRILLVPTHSRVPLDTGLITSAPMANEATSPDRQQILSGVVQTLLTDLKNGTGDKDRRR